MTAFQCMKPEAYKLAVEQLKELKKIIFIMDGDSGGFVEHVWNMRHIHWPVLWGERIADLHERYLQ